MENPFLLFWGVSFRAKWRTDLDGIISGPVHSNSQTLLMPSGGGEPPTLLLSFFLLFLWFGWFVWLGTRQLGQLGGAPPPPSLGGSTHRPSLIKIAALCVWPPGWVETRPSALCFLILLSIVRWFLLVTPRIRVSIERGRVQMCPGI